MIPVDAFDLKILTALQDDGRLTNQELAELAGLSASQCSRRRMRLEEDKVISGYHADLSSEALGFGVIAFIQVTLATHSPDNSKRFRTLVNRIDEIQEAYSLTGDADYVLKAVLRDLKGLSNLVNDVLMPQQSVSKLWVAITVLDLREVFVEEVLGGCVEVLFLLVLVQPQLRVGELGVLLALGR